MIDGPFAEAKELIAGFWLWQLKSKEDAIAWVRRCPNPLLGDAELEIRQVFEAEDFGAEFTPELRAQEERLRAKIAHQASAPTRPELAPVPAARGATPYLIVKGAPEAIRFYEQVFGAHVVMCLDAPDGSVMHAELKVGPAHFMLTQERPEQHALSPLSIGGSGSMAHVHVPDADAAVARALAAGARLTMPVADQFWGARCGNIVDPFGHQWFVATHIEDPSPEEIQRRVCTLFAGRGGCGTTASDRQTLRQ